VVRDMEGQESYVTRQEVRERNQMIVELAAQGETYHSIGQRFGITRQRVDQILRAHRFPRRGPGGKLKPEGRWNMPHHLNVVQLARSGQYTGWEIAQITGVHQGTISAVLRHHGISLVREKRRASHERVKQFVEAQK
jgi:hypothetical protein